MNNVLKFSFAPFIICCIVRWFASKAIGAHLLDFRTFTEWENWLYAISAGLFALSFWHNFIRNKCPRCKSYDVTYLGEEEYNLAHRVKKVNERDNNGNSVTRSLNVTYALLHHYHSCDECNYKWKTKAEREK